MSTATATQGDDLIILSDNINPTFWDEQIVSDNLNFWENNSVISFDSSPVVSETNEISNSPITIDSPIIDSTLSIEENPIGDNQTTSLIEEPLKLDNSENKSTLLEEKSDLDNWVSSLFWDLSSEVKVSTEIQQDSDITMSIEDNDWDMNSILNSTITRLKKRQSWISSQKSDKTSRIIELERQIKELRDQVTMLKKEIVFLDDENIKIEINVWNLESMKIWKQNKIGNKPSRPHNTKKLTK